MLTSVEIAAGRQAQGRERNAVSVPLVDGWISEPLGAQGRLSSTRSGDNRRFWPFFWYSRFVPRCRNSEVVQPVYVASSDV